jgi:hypothetical protein
MSLTITTLDAADGSNDSFTLLGADMIGSTRIDTSSTLSAPRKLVIKHSVSGTGANVIDRHLVQVSDSAVNATGVLKTAVVNMTLAVPRDSVITQIMIDDAVANIISLMSAGAFSVTTGLTSNSNVVALLRGES